MHLRTIGEITQPLNTRQTWWATEMQLWRPGCPTLQWTLHCDDDDDDDGDDDDDNDEDDGGDDDDTVENDEYLIADDKWCLYGH